MTNQPNSAIQELNFLHLQLEMARLRLLLHYQIQRFQQAAPPPPAGHLPLNTLFLSAQDAAFLLERPFGAGYAILLDEAWQPYQEAMDELEQQIGQIVDEAITQNIPLRLVHLAATAELGRLDLDVLLLAFMPLYDRTASKAYAFLQDDLTRKRPSLELILDLFFTQDTARLTALQHFTPDAPLLRHHLITLAAEDGARHTPLIDQAIYLDEGVGHWLLLGEYSPPAPYATAFQWTAVPEPNPVLLTPIQQKQLAAPGAALLLFTGPDALSRTAAAEWVAAARQQPLLTLDLAQIEEAHHLQAISLLLRDARLLQALPHMTGWDTCLQDDAPPPALLKPVLAHPDGVVVSGQARWQARQVNRQRDIRHFHFARPDVHRRQALLQYYLGAAADVALPLTAVAGQFQLDSAQLRDLVRTARDLAAQDGRTIQSSDLFAAARTHSNPRLGELARKITPRYTWDDLILAEDSVTILHEMVDTVRQRPLVLETWGVGKKLSSSGGITALFYGPPGTGKTMGAEVIAGELGLDLFKIDLSTMVSKYIGETEKNLERIFTEAESSNAILFFDEADAIFGKRSEVKDAHDRYANIEISYLLQRMEAYNGVTILATNLKANLDEAFTRRLQFALDFPFPKAPDRLRIWQTLFPPHVPRADDLDWHYLAERFEITGGNIRNIIVTAAYLAASNGQVVTMEHMLHGTRRELQKMGRLVNERDLVR